MPIELLYHILFSDICNQEYACNLLPSMVFTGADWNLQVMSIGEGGNTELELFSFSCVDSLRKTGLKVVQIYFCFRTQETALSKFMRYSC